MSPPTELVKSHYDCKGAHIIFKNLYYVSKDTLQECKAYLKGKQLSFQRLNKTSIFLYVENFLVDFRWYFIIHCGLSKSTKIVHLRKKFK